MIKMQTPVTCPKCGSTDLEKGHQEMFPATFMKDTKFSLLKALDESKEFEIYACMKCGYSQWYVRAVDIESRYR